MVAVSPPRFRLRISLMGNQPPVSHGIGRACRLHLQPSNRSILVKALDAGFHPACLGAHFKVQWIFDLHELCS